MAMPTTYERPVLRDPKTGLLCQYQAFGTLPTRHPTQRGDLIAMLVGALAAAVVVFVWGL